MDLQKLFADLLVVIVLYKTKPQESAAYSSIHTALNLFPSFPEIFIYDNSPEESSVDGDHITYFHDFQNNGVSKAYNHAALVGMAKNKKWMLFFDQDTTVRVELFDKFAEAIDLHPESVTFVPGLKDRKGYVSPFLYKAGTGRRIKAPGEKLSLANFRFMNSGLLVNHAAFVSAGGYNESIPLDFSDIAFGERLRKVTDHFCVIDVTLRHHFSATEMLSAQEALTRFHQFCTGALAMSRISGPSYVYFVRIFLRALRLCVQYTNLGFLRISLQRTIDD